MNDRTLIWFIITRCHCFTVIVQLNLPGICALYRRLLEQAK